MAFKGVDTALGSSIDVAMKACGWRLFDIQAGDIGEDSWTAFLIPQHLNSHIVKEQRNKIRLRYVHVDIRLPTFDLAACPFLPREAQDI